MASIWRGHLPVSRLFEATLALALGSTWAVCATEGVRLAPTASMLRGHLPVRRLLPFTSAAGMPSAVGGKVGALGKSHKGTTAAGVTGASTQAGAGAGGSSSCMSEASPDERSLSLGTGGSSNDDAARTAVRLRLGVRKMGATGKPMSLVSYGIRQELAATSPPGRGAARGARWRPHNCPTGECVLQEPHLMPHWHDQREEIGLDAQWGQVRGTQAAPLSRRVRATLRHHVQLGQLSQRACGGVTAVGWERPSPAISSSAAAPTILGIWSEASLSFLHAGAPRTASARG